MAAATPGDPTAAEPFFDWIKAQEKKKPEGQTHLLGETVAKFQFSSFLELLPGRDGKCTKVAYQGLRVKTGHKTSITHKQLYDFVAHEFDLAQFGITIGDACAVLLPNSPENAVCVVATSTYCCCAPLNPKGTVEEIEFELTNTNAKGLILLNGDDDETAARQAADNCNVKVITLT